MSGAQRKITVWVQVRVAAATAAGGNAGAGPIGPGETWVFRYRPGQESAVLRAVGRLAGRGGAFTWVHCARVAGQVLGIQAGRERAAKSRERSAEGPEPR